MTLSCSLDHASAWTSGRLRSYLMALATVGCTERCPIACFFFSSSRCVCLDSKPRHPCSGLCCDWKLYLAGPVPQLGSLLRSELWMPPCLTAPAPGTRPAGLVRLVVGSLGDPTANQQTYGNWDVSILFTMGVKKLAFLIFTSNFYMSYIFSCWF